MTIDHAIDPEDGVEPVEIIQSDINFLGKIFIDNKSQVLRGAGKDYAGLVIWADGSKLSDSRCGVAVCWKNQTKHTLWRQKSVFLGKNKEILDTEL